MNNLSSINKKEVSYNEHNQYIRYVEKNAHTNFFV